MILVPPYTHFDFKFIDFLSPRAYLFSLLFGSR